MSAEAAETQTIRSAPKGARHMIISHFPTTFRVRGLEWCFAVILTLWGVAVFKMNPATFALFFGALAHIPIWLLATSTVTAGVLRLVTLIINGMWRRSPYVRMFMSTVAGMFWMQISLGLLFSGQVATGWAVYPVIMCFEIYNVLCAAKDARAVEEKFAISGN